MEQTLSPGDTHSDPARLDEARRCVKRLREFYQLLWVAAIVLAISVAVNVVAGGRWWFHWVVLGLAIATAFAAHDTFGRDLWLGRDWRARKVREFLDRQRS